MKEKRKNCDEKLKPEAKRKDSFQQVGTRFKKKKCVCGGRGGGAVPNTEIAKKKQKSKEN